MPLQDFIHPQERLAAKMKGYGIMKRADFLKN